MVSLQEPINDQDKSMSRRVSLYKYKQVWLITIETHRTNNKNTYKEGKDSYG
jgi:hypothetical protein